MKRSVEVAQLGAMAEAACREERAAVAVGDLLAAAYWAAVAEACAVRAFVLSAQDCGARQGVAA